MKVLLSAYRCNPEQGGEPYRTWLWIDNYVKEGNQVVCLTNKWDKEVLENIREKPINCQFEFLDIPEWIEKLYVNQFGVYTHYLLWQHYAVSKARALHKIYQFDMVHHTSYGSIQLGSGMWKLNIPFIYGPMGGGQFPPKGFKKYFKEGWKKEVVRSWLSNLLFLANPNTKKAIRHAHLLMTENMETYELAQKHGAQHIKMFYDGGVPPHKLPDQLIRPEKSPKLRILWVGRLLHQKGLLLALEAVAQLNNKIDFELTILGDGPFGQYLPDWIRDYQLEGKVRWPGQVSWQTVIGHYQKNDVFLFTSLRESSGSQLFEAMAYGMPIVTLDHFGAKALMPDKVGARVPVITPEQTINDLADALLYYNNNEKERLAHGKNGFHYIKDLFSKQVNELVKTLPCLIDQAQEKQTKSRHERVI